MRSARGFGRGLRRLRWLRYLLWLPAVVLTVLALALISLSVPATREWVRARVNESLRDQFVGRVVIDRIGTLRLDLLSGIDAHVTDARGEKVLRVVGLRLQSNWPAILRDAVLGRPLRIALAPISADHIEVRLIGDAEGVPTLFSAFAAKTPSAPSKGPPVTVAISNIDVDHVWIHGGIPAQPVIDGELARLSGSLLSDANGLGIKVNSTQILARSLPGRVDPKGALVASIFIPARDDSIPNGAVRFTGEVVRAPIQLHAALDDGNVTAELSANNIPSHVIREWLPDSELGEQTDLVLSARGKLPAVGFQLDLRSLAGTVAAKGRVEVAETSSVSCELDVAGVDLARLFESQSTKLHARARVELSKPPRAPLGGTYSLDLEPGTFGAQRTPAVQLRGSVLDPVGETRIDGHLHVAESGAPIDGTYSLRRTPTDSGLFSFGVQARFANPARARALMNLELTGKLEAEGEIDLGTSEIRASAEGTLQGLAVGGARAEAVRFEGKAEGPLAEPRIRLDVDGRKIDSGLGVLKGAQVRIVGHVGQMSVAAAAQRDATRAGQIRANVAIGEDVRITDAYGKLTSTRGPVELRAGLVTVSGARVGVERLRIDGMGELDLSGHLSGQRFAAQFKAHKLDLGRIAEWTGNKAFPRGFLDLDGAVRGSVHNPEGVIEGRIAQVSFGDLRDVNSDFSVKLERGKLNGSVATKVQGSHLKLTLADVDWPGTNLQQSRLRAIHGELSAEGQIELDAFRSSLHSFGVPIEQASGTVWLDIDLRNPRGNGDGWVAEGAITTKGLRLVEQRPATAEVDNKSEAHQTQPRVLEGVDLTLRVEVDGKSGRAKVHSTIFDIEGELLGVVGALPVPSLDARQVLDSVRDEPLNIRFRVPERQLEKLPKVIRPNVMRGAIAFDGLVDGSLRSPRVLAQLSTWRLRSGDGKNYVDGALVANYAPGSGALELTARSRRGGTASVKSKWTGDLVRRIQAEAAGNDSIPFDLSADVGFDRFPVGIVPALVESQIRGPLSGEIRLRGLGANARLLASLDGSGVSVNRVRLPRLIAKVESSDNDISAVVEAEQESGAASVEFKTAAKWGRRLVPQIEPRADVRLRAERFQLEALAPLLMSYVSTIEGELDADFSAHLDEAFPKLSGTATLKEGVVQVPQIGQRFSDISAKISVRDGQIRLDSAQARGLTGRVTAQGSARLKGFDLESAEAQLDIKESEKLPVTYEGVMIGDAWGHANVKYRGNATADRSELEVLVPKFRLEMPDVAGNGVQELEPAEGIRIGAHRSDGKFVIVPLAPLESSDPEETSSRTMRVRVRLGESVWIERGRQVSVQLAGHIEIDSGAEQGVSGRIELKGGKLDVSGKRFEIERGVVTFEGEDVANPTITATARWDSPADYVVYADYAGTVENGKLKLRSEPVLTQNEILSLLLFGSPEGNLASGRAAQNNTSNTAAGAGAAVSVAGGTATKGLNRALSDVTSLDVSTRIDTSTGSSRPELVVQLTPRLTTRLTRAIGTPTPGQSPDMTFLTLELRIKRAWSVSAVVGDRGSSAVDLIWRKRY